MVVWVSPGQAVIFELLRWTSERSHAATNELGSTRSTKVVSSVHNPTLPVAADARKFSSTYIHSSACERHILHLAHTVWAQEDATTHCSELATGQPHLLSYPNVERAVDVRLQGEELLPAEFSIVVFQHQSFLLTEEFAQLALQENEPAL